MRKYEVDVVVTLTIEADNPDLASKKATKIVDDCVKGKTNNIYYPEWTTIRKLKC